MGFPPLRAHGSGDSSRPSLTILGARGRKREGAIRAPLLRQENKNTRRGGQTRSDTAWGGPERANAASSPGSGTGLVAIKMGGCHGNAPIPLGPLPSRSVEEARGARGCTGGQGIAPRLPSGGVASIFIYIY